MEVLRYVFSYLLLFVEIGHDHLGQNQRALGHRPDLCLPRLHLSLRRHLHSLWLVAHGSQVSRSHVCDRACASVCAIRGERVKRLIGSKGRGTAMLVVQRMKAYRFASRALPSRAKGVGLGSLWTALRESISLRCLCGASSNSRLAVMSWRTSKSSTALLLNSRSISFSLMCPAGQLSHHSHPTPLLTSTLLPRPVFPLTRTPFLLPPHLRLFQTRLYSSLSDANKSTARYFIAVAIVVVGLSYAAVPLYRLYCQASGYGGTVSVVDAGEKVEKMVPVREREITIR